jgi:hypothetical protein
MNTRIWKLMALIATLTMLVSLMSGTPAVLAKDPTPLEQALAGKYTGTTVTVGGIWGGA